MTQLELQQRGLLDLIKGRGAPPVDPYLRRVAASPELALLREIAVWWRALEIEEQCRFTPRLLKRRCFEAFVAAYFEGHAASAFVEELSLDFLGSLRAHPDPLISAMSRFEHAFLEARAGSGEPVEVVWDRHPDRVFLALETGVELPPPEPGASYHMRIARELPRMIACTRTRHGP